MSKNNKLVSNPKQLESLPTEQPFCNISIGLKSIFYKLKCNIRHQHRCEPKWELTEPNWPHFQDFHPKFCLNILPSNYNVGLQLLKMLNVRILNNYFRPFPVYFRSSWLTPQSEWRSEPDIFSFLFHIQQAWNIFSGIQKINSFKWSIIIFESDWPTAMKLKAFKHAIIIIINFLGLKNL